MKGFIAVIAAVVMFAIANTAAAEVRLDPEAGTGFVGKGDVQDAFVWNDAALQQNALFVGFFYIATEITPSAARARLAPRAFTCRPEGPRANS